MNLKYYRPRTAIIHRIRCSSQEVLWGLFYKELTEALGKTRALSLRTVERWTSDLRNGLTTSTLDAQIRQKTASDEAHFDQLEDLLEESKSWSARELALLMGIRYPSFEILETQLDIEIRALNDGRI
jgi:transposase